ncbi:MAG: Asp-tRNA(Asn)/Glu-tRNA(Gln) amidotransferase subunit GatB, partial [Atopobiaceae bacterium]|nr:Asp-tRNA(Asn)/Glu-tRNA(Gln) amidotransferase subunit GatB [Atopobiaceae bacterium]
TTLETKMFCGCKLSHDDEPNANVCPICLGMPGALPVPNEKAIESIVMAGIATNCEVMRRSMFYRKHYFYPDMAKNFQTTQGPVAFVMHGHLDLEVSGDGARERPEGTIEKAPDGSYVAPIRILRIHMEEDAAKMNHLGGAEGRIGGATESLIDYNRCGTPLIELVTEPDLRTPEEARLFMEKLRQIFLTLGISDCSLEHGSMRCDGNVSLRRRGTQELGTKSELKNLNSFKSLHDALAYEICRQAEVLESGGTILQETRHWEPSRKRTVVMRVKETADDYRMYPDPDLVPFDLSDQFVARCRARVPELPDAKRSRYVSVWGLKPYDAARIAGEPAMASLFEAAVQAVGTSEVPMVANVVVNLVFGREDLMPRQVAGLARLLAGDAITFAQARELVELVAGTDRDPEKTADERGLRQSTDVQALADIVETVLQTCDDQVRQYRAGNKKVVGFLVGQCMKASRGNGNPKLFHQLLTQRLES